MKIKFLFLIITALAFNSCRKHEIERKPRSFVKYYDTGITDDIVGLSFLDKNNGLAIANPLFGNGVVIKTTDGGKTWAKKTVPYLSKLVKVQYFNSNIAYLMADTILYKSIDAGETWNIIKTGGFYFQNCDFHFVTNLLGYQTDPTKGIFKTIDGGGNWSLIINSTNQLIGNSSFFQEINCPSENTIYSKVYKGSYFIIKSKDGGLTWERLPDINLSNYSSYFFTENDGFITTSEKLYKTIDGGQSWSDIGNFRLGGLKMANEEIGLATGTSNDGYSYGLNLTNNGGNSWVPSIDGVDYSGSEKHEPMPASLDYQGFSDRTIYLACSSGKFGVITFYNLGE